MNTSLNSTSMTLNLSNLPVIEASLDDKTTPEKLDTARKKKKKKTKKKLAHDEDQSQEAS